MNDLDILIKNLTAIQNGTIWKRKDIKAKILQCYKAVLYEVALKQVNDTSHARALIVKVFCDKFGLETVDLQDLNNNRHFWEKNGFPENADKDWNSAREGDGVNIISNGLNVNLVFDTPEITNQALGVVKFNGMYKSPSVYNPYIEPQMEVYHIDTTVDEANLGNLVLLNDTMERLCDTVANEIVKGLGV
jgi:hypothetical protein